MPCSPSSGCRPSTRTTPSGRCERRSRCRPPSEARPPRRSDGDLRPLRADRHRDRRGARRPRSRFWCSRPVRDGRCGQHGGAAADARPSPARSSSARRRTPDAREVVDYEELPPVALKGKADLVVAWRAVTVKARRGGLRSPLGIEAPLVGRQDELGIAQGDGPSRGHHRPTATRHGHRRRRGREVAPDLGAREVPRWAP